MKISIVLTTYNGEAFLHEQLQSYAEQSRLPDELVVCDDGSKDRTLEIIKTFAATAPFEVRLFRANERLGLTRNFERALCFARGDILFISDQDDVWLHTKIAEVIKCFAGHHGIDVVINDAYYGDRSLVSRGETVLQRVLAAGAPRSSHIAGACTTITSAFRDFLVPFPADDVPQYDVYIHRWANVLRNKCLIDYPLQTWRIHGANASRHNEMSQPSLASPFSRYREFKDSPSEHAYAKVVREFEVMKRLLDERRYLWLRGSAGEPDRCRKEIETVIEAHRLRAQLAQENHIRKLRLLWLLLIRGHYRQFKGIYSLAKDLLR
jgi:glycosyltransferase involved in cell wall biosynthesis